MWKRKLERIINKDNIQEIMLFTDRDKTYSTGLEKGKV